MTCTYRLPAVVAVTTIVLFAAACAADQQDSHPKQATSPSSAEEWGPLAVHQSGNAVPDHTVSGTLRIGPDCVTFEEKAGALIIWPSGRTKWNADTGTITLESALDKEKRQPVVLEDGDTVVFRGFEKIPPESEVRDIDKLDWVNPPEPTCRSDHRVFIGFFDRRASTDSS